MRVRMGSRSTSNLSMHRKSQWARPFFYLVAGQLAALATGLILHQHLVTQSLCAECQARTFAELTVIANDARTQLSVPGGGARPGMRPARSARTLSC